MSIHEIGETAARKALREKTSAEYYTNLLPPQREPVPFLVQWMAAAARREQNDNPKATHTLNVVLKGNTATLREIAGRRETSRHVIVFPNRGEGEELQIVEAPPAPPFEREPSIQAEAAQALAALNDRPRKTRSTARPVPLPAGPGLWKGIGYAFAAIGMVVGFAFAIRLVLR